MKGPWTLRLETLPSLEEKERGLESLDCAGAHPGLSKAAPVGPPFMHANSSAANLPGAGAGAGSGADAGADAGAEAGAEEG